MNGTCLLPWFSLHVWGAGSVVCCFLTKYTGLYENLVGGPYAGEDVWLNEAAEDLRKRMRFEGPTAICKLDCTCWSHHGTWDFEHQVRSFRSRVGGTDEQWAEVCAAARGEAPTPRYPLSVHAYLGSRCNCACPMCEVRWQKPQQSLVTPVAMANLRALCSHSTYVHLSGGDLFALNDEQIADAITIAPPGCNIETTTNGQGLTLARWKRFVQNGPIAIVRVSLDTADPEEYQKQRGVPFAKVARNLQDIAREAGDSPNRVQVLFCAVNGWTLKGLPGLARFAASINVKRLSITPTYGNHLAMTGNAAVDLFGRGWTPEWAKVAKDVQDELAAVCAEVGVAVTGLDTLQWIVDRTHNHALD